MEQKQAAKLISENLKNIFAFSLSRLYDKDAAEDLTQDIVCKVLASAKRLKDDGAFYGFMWRIAENTFKKYIRRRSRETVRFDESFAGAIWENPEVAIVDREEANILRRELALLSKQYRQSTVAYYIYGKSCSEIAAELRIPIEMVKYYLFKTRKILKEGFGMTREYGEKSYNPGTFRMDYWGSGDNSAFWALFKRKLPGNIVLAAYNAPVTMQELSMELGVAVPYLEDEVEILQRHEILKKTGDKYQTDIVIFTDECEKEVTAKIKPLYESAAEKLHTKLKAILPELKKLEFQGQNYDDKTLLWVFANLTNVHALNMADKKQCERFGEYPPLCNGSSGFVFGYDHDYQNHHFNGIYGRCENEENTAYFTVINYRIIEKIQWWEPAAWYISVKAMTDAVLQKPADEDNDMLVRLIGEGFIKCEDGKTRANFPVFPEDVFEGDLRRLLQPLADDVCACMLEACDIAAAVLKKHAPKQLHAKCDLLAAVHYQMDIMAFMVETMVQKGMLAMPKGDAKPCVFGVKK